MNIQEEIANRGSIYRHVQGNGILSNKSQQLKVECTFDLVQYQNGRIYLFCEILSSFIQKSFVNSFSPPENRIVQITGVTKPNLNVNCNDLMCVSLRKEEESDRFYQTFSASQVCLSSLSDEEIANSHLTFEFPLVNFDAPFEDPVRENEKDEIVGNSKSTDISFGNRVFTLSPVDKAPEIIKDLESTKTSAVTATLRTDDQGLSCQKAIEKDVHHFLAPLSLVQGTRINRLGCDIKTSSNQIANQFGLTE